MEIICSRVVTYVNYCAAERGDINVAGAVAGFSAKQRTTS
jgi:hypothetical protein